MDVKTAQFKRNAETALADEQIQHSLARAIHHFDEARDIEAARKAGIAAGSVAWGYAEADFLRSLRPDHFFATVDDIAAALSGGRDRL